MGVGVDAPALPGILDAPPTSLQLLSNRGAAAHPRAGSWDVCPAPPFLPACWEGGTENVLWCGRASRRDAYYLDGIRIPRSTTSHQGARGGRWGLVMWDFHPGGGVLTRGPSRSSDGERLSSG